MSDHPLLSIPGFTDPVSSLTHLIGAGVFAVLSVPLVRHGWRAGHTPWRVASLMTFAASAVFLLSMSGVYHMMETGGMARQVMQRLDHAGIFILIAGTFTPIHAILFKGPWRWGMLAFIWTLAIAGVTLKTIFFGATGTTLGLALYVGMGWVGALSMYAIWRRFGPRMVFHLAMGGLVYTIGAGVELLEPRELVAGVIRAHELFHVACLGGLAFHWRLVWVITGHESLKAKHERLAREKAETRTGNRAGGGSGLPGEVAVTVGRVQGELTGAGEATGFGVGHERKN